MIHVTRTEERSATMITVDGELSGDSIDVLEMFCKQAGSAGKAVQVFLRNVSVVDQNGRMFLARLATKGVRLSASGVYVAHLVQELNSTAAPWKGRIQNEGGVSCAPVGRRR